MTDHEDDVCPDCGKVHEKHADGVELADATIKAVMDSMPDRASPVFLAKMIANIAYTYNIKEDHLAETLKLSLQMFILMKHEEKNGGQPIRGVVKEDAPRKKKNNVH